MQNISFCNSPPKKHLKARFFHFCASFCIMQRAPPRINRLRAMQKGSDFTLKKQNCIFSAFAEPFYSICWSLRKICFCFLGADPVFQYTVYPWFSLLITVLKPVKQALPPPEYPAQPHWGDGRLMRFECVRRCASFLAAGAVPFLAALHACGKFHCFARHTSRFALMQQPAAYNKAPANRRGDGQKA